MTTAPPLRRVVVTGIGAVTPLGATFAETWERLLRKESGTTSLEEALHCQNLSSEALDREWALARDLPCQVAAPVRSTYANDTRTSRCVHFVLQAGDEAIRQANLSDWFTPNNNNNDTTSTLDPIYQQRRYRAGVSLGNGMSSLRLITDAVRTIEQSGLRKLSPHFVPLVLSNSAAGRLSLRYHLQGPNLTASTACAAGSHAIGDAMQCIQYNRADIMLAGGTEACIDPLSLNGFCRLRALSTTPDIPPEAASRPFDRRRDGFVMGEGAAVLVLEELEHALARQAPIIMAQVVGYGASGDAHHMTAPSGEGAARAMQIALFDNDSPVDYVNAHATSTPKGDEIEARVIDQVLQQQQDRNVLVSSTKGATGHLLGAAGALEAAITVQTIVDGQVPPTLNLEDPEDDVIATVGFDHVYETTARDVRVAVSNSFGFGGTNASLVFQKV